MSRQSLQRELEKYLQYAEKEGRKELAKNYQQEVILHVDDYTDALFIEYEKEHGLERIDRRTKRGKKLKEAFEEGGKVIVDRLDDKISGMRKSDGITTYPKDVLQIEKFDNGRGIVIYMLNQNQFNWETPKFKSALTEAKRMGLKEVNAKLAELNTKDSDVKEFRNPGAVNANIFGHHGGISGADPKSTYGLTGISEAVDKTKKIDLASVTLMERIDDNDKLDTYSDIFFKRLGDQLEVKGFWDAKKNARRPTNSRPSEMDDENVIRIVLGHGDLKSFMGGFDKVRGGQRNWTKLGPTLQKLLEDTRDQLEKDILKQLGRDAKDFAFFEGSESSITRAKKLAGEQVVKRLVQGANKKKKIAKGKSQSVKKPKSKTQAKNKAKKGAKNTVSRKMASRAGIRITGTKSGKGKRTSAATSSPVGLVALLNKSLATELIKNMGPYPRVLENRTGRFANSAEVTNVSPMPNSVEIQYTYQKDPYAVFEPENGNPLASHGRDPRRIIGRTIREIAQEIMGTKYGLVRTKRV